MDINIIIAVVTLLGGYFGIPKLIEAWMRKRQTANIRKKADKLIDKLEKKLIRDSKNKSNSADPLLDEVYNLLFNAKDSLKNKEFLQDQLNKIIRNLYDAELDEEILKLKAKFDDYFEFNSESWANIAISNMNLYHLDGMKEFRENSLEACKESLKRSANYGEPKAVVLVINMIDYERKKQINKDDIKKMLIEINSGEDTLVSYETYNYLNDIRKLKEWEKYIVHLETLYSDEMSKMSERYNSYVNYKKKRRGTDK